MTTREDIIRQLVAITQGDLNEFRQAAEARARARPGPWPWYCRLCGATGEAPTEEDRDAAGRAHLKQTRCGQHAVTGWATAGKLLHVWTYPASAIAGWN